MAELPEEVGGAIRMVAFGVLEYEQPEYHPSMDFIIAGRKSAQADEIEELVCKDVHALGWKLASVAYKAGQFILLGRAGGSAALPTRPKIGQGTLQQVCRAAVDWLDKGPQPSPQPPHSRCEAYSKR